MSPLFAVGVSAWSINIHHHHILGLVRDTNFKLEVQIRTNRHKYKVQSEFLNFTSEPSFCSWRDSLIINLDNPESGLVRRTNFKEIWIFKYKLAQIGTNIRCNLNFQILNLNPKPKSLNPFLAVDVSAWQSTIWVLLKMKCWEPLNPHHVLK